MIAQSLEKGESGLMGSLSLKRMLVFCDFISFLIPISLYFRQALCQMESRFSTAVARRITSIAKAEGTQRTATLSST